MVLMRNTCQMLTALTRDLQDMVEKQCFMLKMGAWTGSTLWKFEFKISFEKGLASFLGRLHLI